MKTMKVYRTMGPSGEWLQTTAPTAARARSNLAYRLRRLGMPAARARDWVEDTEEVKPWSRP